MSDNLDAPKISLVFDRAINYAFQQNAIPVIKELKFCNDATARKNLRLKLATEPAFAEPVEIRLQGIAPQGEYRAAPLELKLSPDFLSALAEKVSGLFKCEVLDGDAVVCSLAGHPLAWLACEEWTPGWAENVLTQLRDVGAHVQRLESVYADLRQWLHCPAEHPGHKLLNDLAALVESLLSPQPVGPAFATTSWNNLSSQLDSWIKLVQERSQLRQSIGVLAKSADAGSAAVGCESWNDIQAADISKQCEEVVRLTSWRTSGSPRCRGILWRRVKFNSHSWNQRANAKRRPLNY